ncbi:hypothetical protein Corgl_0922 [Coriobacterium glomerans PW2]|uniref:Uncharacterized protein n=1 Tax=Coriobacterium glomerans (strain ATCC 49209 / DSM 20642 / JCM 10262 / PW2) TaxID=700015 RepID=F2N9K4_CORGP|nr:hypothetical protein Corgl_0922 [Coriobacterium glomerans PW2]
MGSPVQEGRRARALPSRSSLDAESPAARIAYKRWRAQAPAIALRKIDRDEKEARKERKAMSGMVATGNETVASAVIRGVEARPVKIECCIERGMAQFVFNGVSDAAALELRPRVRCAIRGAGYAVPHASVTITVSSFDQDNDSIRLAASDRHIELAIAAAVLAASGQVPAGAVDGRLLVGSLEPDGGASLNRRAAPYAELARERGLELLAGPASGAGSLPGTPALHRAAQRAQTRSRGGIHSATPPRAYRARCRSGRVAEAGTRQDRTCS